MAVSARKLDHSQPYGTVCGASNGAMYEQHGILFNHAGDEILPEGVPVKTAAKPAARKNTIAATVPLQVIEDPADTTIAAATAMAQAFIASGEHAEVIDPQPTFSGDGGLFDGGGAGDSFSGGDE